VFFTEWAKGEYLGCHDRFAASLFEKRSGRKENMLKSNARDGLASSLAEILGIPTTACGAKN